jgi:hypothetical protein
MSNIQHLGKNHLLRHCTQCASTSTRRFFSIKITSNLPSPHFRTLTIRHWTKHQWQIWMTQCFDSNYIGYGSRISCLKLMLCTSGAFTIDSSTPTMRWNLKKHPIYNVRSISRVIVSLAELKMQPTIHFQS